jgi:WhiB family transcriptional regulator, redox-sensing transcriptional regulator
MAFGQRYVAAPKGGRLAVRTLASRDKAWLDRGACRGLDPQIFYPDENDDAFEAKAICAECSVKVTCLEYALTFREKDGVWGGATERERRRIIRQRRRSA